MGIRTEFSNQPITAVSTAAAVLVTLFGFWFTYHELQSGARALRAANTYQIQKDAREAVAQLRANSNFRALISGGTPKDKTDAQEAVWLMLNFYLSVYRQDKSEGLTPDFAAAFSKDFCDFVARKPVGAVWDSMLKSSQIGAGHQAMKEEWCGKRA